LQAPDGPGATAVGMIVLFPTYARRIPGTASWEASVAGMVSRPLPEWSRRRVLAVKVLRRLLDLREADVETEIFRRRAESFFFERVAGCRVEIDLGGRRLSVGPTDRIGHFRADFNLDGDLTSAATAIPFRALVTVGDLGGQETHGGDPTASAGWIHLVEEQGLSIVSDIDDTVKITNVANRRELLRNTLLRDFAAVPGMADVYRGWQEEGTAFHYVSASPWQLSRCLCGFLDEAGLPAGSMHLKLFRLKDSTPLGRLPSRKRSKRRVIEQIMDHFPRRRFVLVGDSGERDPEVYAAVARRRPEQVAGIAIRLVESRATPRKQRERLGRLARRVTRAELDFHVFTEAEELAAWRNSLTLESPITTDSRTHSGSARSPGPHRQEREP
jgi:phosphatidate phosphatase APP1